MSWTPLYDWFRGQKGKPSAVPPVTPRPPSTSVFIPAADGPKPTLSRKRFEECLVPLLVFEGGLDDDPYDPGGRTAYGILQTEYNKWRREQKLPVQDVFKISPWERSEIYYTKYWLVSNCDRLPIGSDLMVFDYHVNAGLGQVARDAQRSVGIHVDGDWGPKTVDAIRAMDPREFCNRLNANRLVFYKKLGTYWRFGKGWTSRSNQCLRLAHAAIEGKK